MGVDFIAAPDVVGEEATEILQLFFCWKAPLEECVMPRVVGVQKPGEDELMKTRTLRKVDLPLTILQIDGRNNEDVRTLDVEDP